jgi:hypothetical protein
MVETLSLSAAASTIEATERRRSSSRLTACATTPPRRPPARTCATSSASSSRDSVSISAFCVPGFRTVSSAPRATQESSAVTLIPSRRAARVQLDHQPVSGALGAAPCGRIEHSAGEPPQIDHGLGDGYLIHRPRLSLTWRIRVDSSNL